MKLIENTIKNYQNFDENKVKFYLSETNLKRLKSLFKKLGFSLREHNDYLSDDEKRELKPGTGILDDDKIIMAYPKSDVGKAILETILYPYNENVMDIQKIEREDGDNEGTYYSGEKVLLALQILSELDYKDELGFKSDTIKIWQGKLLPLVIENEHLGFMIAPKNLENEF